MKKFFVFFLGVLFALQSTVAFAQTAPVSVKMSSRAVRQVSGVEHWLNRNDFQGIKYMDDNFIHAKALAQAWDHDAQMYGMHVYFPTISNSSCMFEFGSENKPGMVYSVLCRDDASKDTGSASASAEISNDKLFSFTSLYPVRRFLSEILASGETVNKIADTFKMNGLQALSFDYLKDSVGLSWSAELTANGKTSTMDIFGDVEADGGLKLTTQQK